MAMRPAAPLPGARRGWRAAAALAPLALLAGCVVAPYGTHYRASTTQPGAQEVKAWCGGLAGPVTGLAMDLGGGVRLEAFTQAERAEGVPLRLDLVVPAGPGFAFAGPVRVLADGRELAVPFTGAVRRSVRVEPGQEIDAARLRPGRASRDAAAPQGELLLHLQTAAPVPSRIAVQGPELVFADGAGRLPPVELARSARKPFLFVSGGPDSSRESVEGTLPAMRWSGRWLYRDTHAEAELKLRPRDARPFRLETASLQWRDANGAVLPVRLARAELWFDDRFAPGQDIGAAPFETRVALEATLAPGISAFVVQWPDMLHAGRRLTVAPLRFERRSLSGGVQPFNC
jgi:hypothetical protein